MSLRDLDIDVDIEVDSGELILADERLDSFIEKWRSLDDKLNLGIDLDINGALAQLEALDSYVDDLDNSIINIRTDIDDSMVLAQLAALQAQIDNVDNNDIDVDIDIHTDFANTLAQLQVLESQINSLDGDNVFIDVDIENASGEILALRTQLRLLESQSNNINVDLDTAAAHAQLAALQAHLQTLSAGAGNGPEIGGNIGSLGGSIGSLGWIGGATKLATIGIALPAIASAAQVAVGAVGALGVVLGNVAVGALSLGSAVGVAGIGVASFGAMAVPAITALYEENAKLTTAQVELKKHTDSVIDSWEGLKTATQGVTFDAIESGTKVVNRLIDEATPIVQNATGAFDNLMGSLNQSLQGNEMQGFFSYLERSVGPLTENIGSGLGSALKGVTNTMVALEPLTNWAGQGFENAMGRFASWTEGAKDSDGFKSFMESTKTNLTSLGGILKDAGKGVGQFFVAFDVTATEGLDWLEGKMKDFSNWTENLGENKGFQDMLKNIATDGPEIAKTIGNVTKNVMELTNTLSNIGKDENGEGGIWAWLSDMTSGENIPKLDFAEIFKGGALGMGLDALGIDINWSKILGIDALGEAASSIGSEISSMFNNLGSNIYQAIQGSNMPSFLKDGLSKMFEGFDMTLPDASIDNMVQGAMTQVENAMNGTGGSSAYSKELSLFKGTEVKLDVGANTTPAESAIDGVTQGKEIEANVNANTSKAEQQLQQIGSAKDIQAKVDADTAVAQSKLNALDATPIKIKTDTSAISAQIGSMAATVQLNADTAAIRNEIQNMPGANIKLNADKASLKNSIGNLDADVVLKAKKIDITNNIQMVDVPVNPILQQTTGLFGTTPTTMNVTPKFTKDPKIDDMTVNLKFKYEKPKIDNLTAKLKLEYEKPKIDDLKAKIQITADTGKLQVTFPKFSWPSYNKFSWPSYPKFSWPAYPKFSWPSYPKFSWPSYNKFSWPAYPKFSWPPMPTVKVNVSGAANGSHASGLGRVPFDNYVGNLHKDESVLTAAQSDQLRSIGALKGNGESPELDMSAIANYNPASASSNPKASVARTSNSKTSNTTNYKISVQIDGSKSPEQTGASVVEQLQNWVASLEDANPSVYEF